MLDSLLTFLGGFSSESLVRKLVETKVDDQVALSMGDALARNDLKLFKKLSLDVMSKSHVDVGNVLRTHLDHMIDGLLESVSFMTGDSATSMAAVALMGGIVVALIFKGFLLLALILMFGAVLLVQLVKAHIEKLRALKQQLTRPQTSALACVPAAKLQNVFPHLIEQCETSQEISPAVIKKMTQMEALSLMHRTVETCGKLTAVVQGNLDNGACVAGATKDVAASQQRIAAGIERMKDCVNQMRKATKAQVACIVKTCEHADNWIDEVKAFDCSLTRRAAKLPCRPDSLLTPDERARKENILEGIRRDTKDLVTLVNKGCEDLEGSQVEMDVEKVMEACNDMVQALAFSPGVEEDQKQAVEKAMENRKEVNDRFVSANKERIKTEADIRGLQDKLNNAQVTHERKLLELERALSEHKKLASQLGRGSVTMRGSPPFGDAIAQKLHKAWMDGRWGDLHSYSTCSQWGTTFSIEIDSNLKPAQKEAMNNMNRIVDEVAELKRKHQEEAMELNSKASELRATIKVQKNAEEEARRAMDKAKATDEVSWANFSMSHPVEYSTIKRLYEVNDCVQKAAEWSSDKVNPELAMIRTYVKELARTDDFHPLELQPSVRGIKHLLEDNHTSPMAFVKSIGGFKLRQLLMPKVNVDADALEKLKTFGDTFGDKAEKARDLADAKIEDARRLTDVAREVD